MDKDKFKKEIIALVDILKAQADMIKDNDITAEAEAESILWNAMQLHENAVLFNYFNSKTETEATKDIAETFNPVEPEHQEYIVEPREQVINSIVEPLEVLAIEEEQAPKEITTAPVDLFGDEIPPIEKPKEDKKEEVKEVQKPKREHSKPPVSDIKAAIGINDKFQFINELFHESAEEYATAIQQLNVCENLESALLYFESIQKLYSWDLENETVKRLLDLVYRRFS
jgi:hypothetical protein